LFVWITGTATSNNGTIVVPTTSNGGFWRRIFDGPINVRWFGARGNGTTDDTAAIQTAINAVASAGGLVGARYCCCYDTLPTTVWSVDPG
jgi:hypothetical protein